MHDNTCFTFHTPGTAVTGFLSDDGTIALDSSSKDNSSWTDHGSMTITELYYFCALIIDAEEATGRIANGRVFHTQLQQLCDNLTNRIETREQ